MAIKQENERKKFSKRENKTKIYGQNDENRDRYKSGLEARNEKIKDG